MKRKEKKEEEKKHVDVERKGICESVYSLLNLNINSTLQLLATASAKAV